MRNTAIIYATLILLVIGTAACGGEKGGASAPEAAAGGLTQEQMEKGIGPVTEVSLGTGVDAAMATKGGEVFAMKCSACHKMDQRYVGPPLGDVVDRRTPEFVMNMMLNPAEMLQQHPEAKGLLAEYMTPMPDQNLTEDEARAVLEYLRQENEKIIQ